MPEDYDILKHIILPLVIIGLHWELYNIKSKFPDHEATVGKDWDAAFILLWAGVTVYTNFMFFYRG